MTSSEVAASMASAVVTFPTTWPLWAVMSSPKAFSTFSVMASRLFSASVSKRFTVSGLTLIFSKISTIIFLFSTRLIKGLLTKLLKQKPLELIAENFKIFNIFKIPIYTCQFYEMKFQLSFSLWVDTGQCFAITARLDATTKFNLLEIFVSFQQILNCTHIFLNIT